MPVRRLEFPEIHRYHPKTEISDRHVTIIKYLMYGMGLITALLIFKTR